MSDAPIALRRAGAEDAAAIARLLPDLGYAADASEVGRRLERLAAHGDEVWLAEAGGEALGVLALQVAPLLHRAPGVARVTALVVAAAAQSRGVGRLLLARAEASARAAGCERIELTSNAARARAHRFYRREGYDSPSIYFAKKLG